jgi:hypothetical protein
MPGQYTVALIANGQTYTQPLTIKMDPRVKTPDADLAQQFKLSRQLYDDAQTFSESMQQVSAVRKQVQELQKNPSAKELAPALDALNQKLQAVGGGEGGRGGRGGAAEPKSFSAMRGALLGLMGVLQEADTAPTSQAVAAISDLQKSEKAIFDNWQSLKTQDIPALNAQLKTAKLPEVKLTGTSSGSN